MHTLAHDLPLEDPLLQLREWVTVQDSPDGQLRLLSWNRLSGGTHHHMAAVAQFRTREGVTRAPQHQPARPSPRWMKQNPPRISPSSIFFHWRAIPFPTWRSAGGLTAAAIITRRLAFYALKETRSSTAPTASTTKPTCAYSPPVLTALASISTPLPGNFPTANSSPTKTLASCVQREGK